jgi:hypothetical protein
VKSSTYRSAKRKSTGTVIIQSVSLKLPTVLLLVEFNNAMALAVLTERDFVGTCGGCEIAVF